jgi:hypothetical protein
MTAPEELLDQAEIDLADIAYDVEASGGLDRRRFMFLSLVAAAAGTFAHAASMRAQSPSGGAQGQPAQPPLPLGNGEATALQFQPYPGGTGALMEKTARERGRGAFDRAVFTVEPWTGPVPSSPDDIAFLPAHRLSALIKARRISSRQLTELYLERLKRLNPILLCAVTIMESQALAEAARADDEIRAGRYRGPLHGLPYGVKDLFSTKGVPTTWGAKDFEERVIDEDAEIVRRPSERGVSLLAQWHRDLRGGDALTRRHPAVSDQF